MHATVVTISVCYTESWGGENGISGIKYWNNCISGISGKQLLVSYNHYVNGQVGYTCERDAKKELFTQINKKYGARSTWIF